MFILYSSSLYVFKLLSNPLPGHESGDPKSLLARFSETRPVSETSSLQLGAKDCGQSAAAHALTPATVDRFLHADFAEVSELGQTSSFTAVEC